MDEKIMLGGLEFEVIDQPHAGFTRRLFAWWNTYVGDMADAFDEFNVDVLVRQMTPASMHGLLTAFYPDLPKRFPLHEWLGYRSEGRMEAGEHDPEYEDQTPTVPQMVTALNAGLDVNGRKTILEMLGVVDPKVRQLAWMVMRAKLVSLWESSPSSPPENGESGPTISGESDPLSTETIAA